MKAKAPPYYLHGIPPVMVRCKQCGTVKPQAEAFHRETFYDGKQTYRAECKQCGMLYVEECAAKHSTTGPVLMFSRRSVIAGILPSRAVFYWHILDRAGTMKNKVLRPLEILAAEKRGQYYD